MSYFKNIFNCLCFKCIKIKIYNKNNSISLSDDNQTHDNKKLTQPTSRTNAQAPHCSFACPAHSHIRACRETPFHP